MPDTEPVPEADREEQERPPSADLRAGHPHPADRPEADVLEQEQPVVDVEPPPGVDADRSEEEDWLAERREPDDPANPADRLDRHTER